ncbi:MAG: hypothetical protein JJU45_01190 [Acidimicrobiia bacterium]|nr:hypothetical protein [Acidimicrobiia bacterium]
MQPTALHYAAAAKALAATARRLDLVAPTFRTPPRRPGVHRTLCRSPQGGATVAVTLRGRPWPAVLADMVDGVVAANDLAELDADTTRAALWSALVTAGLVDPAAGPHTGDSAATRPGDRRRVRIVRPALDDAPSTPSAA